MTTFKKLLSNLAFNPSLIGQVSFYAKRVRSESAIRRTGAIFLVLAIAVQVFAVASPPQSTLASSNNDLIDGGIGSVSAAVQACQNGGPNHDYDTILSYYQITCDDVSRASVVSISSVDHNRQLYSMGHLAYGKAGETPVSINGETLWWRYLWSWDTAGPSTYQALQFTNSRGTPFWILFNCGNLVSVGIPPSPPDLQITKATIPGYAANGATVAPGQDIGYRVYFSNTGGSAANTVFVEDPIPANTTPTGWQGTGGATQLNIDAGSFPGHPNTLHAWWSYGQMPAGATNYFVDYTTKVNANVPDGTQICNVAYIRSLEYQVKQSNQICMTVKIPAKTPTPTSTNVPPVTSTPVPPTVTVPVCKYDTNLPENSPSCKPCTSSKNIEDQLSCLNFSKTATNVTEKIADANGTTAQPGDSIEYTLKVTNPTSSTVKGFVIQDGMSDILDYATITDAHGGTVDERGNISWPAVDIQSKQSVERVIDIKVKDPIPQTPASTSDPGHFDLVMTNTYGNTINIKLPGTPIKLASVVTTQLPNTGPSMSIYLATALLVIVGYFFARSRLIAKELDIVRNEYATSGGA